MPDNHPRALSADQKQMWDKKVIPLLTQSLPWLVRAFSTIEVLDNPGARTIVQVDSRSRVYLNFGRIDPKGELNETEYAARCALTYAVGVWYILNNSARRGAVHADPTAVDLWNTSATATARTPIIDSITRDNGRTVGQVSNAEDLISPEVVSVSRLEDMARELTGEDVDFPDFITTEDLYDALKESLPKQGSSHKSASGGGTGDGSADGTTTGTSTGTGTGTGTGTAAGTPGDESSDTAPADGTGAGGGDNPTASDGSISPYPVGISTADTLAESAADTTGITGITPDERDELVRNVANDAKSYAAAGNQLPDSVVEWSADTLKDPVIDPMLFFNNTVGGHLDYTRAGTNPTYSRRSRRQPAVSDRVILQGNANVTHDLYIAVDVSGSMGAADLTLALSAVEQLGTERGFNIYYFTVSTMQHEIRKLTPGETPSFERDCAGTDMRVAFDVFSIYGAKTRMVITDGFTPWPTDSEPGTVTVVAIPTRSEEEFSEIAKDVPSFCNPVRLPLEKLS